MSVTFNPSSIRTTSKLGGDETAAQKSWTEMNGNELSLALQADHFKKFDYLTALDERRATMAAELTQKKREGTLQLSDLDEYNLINQHINELQDNPPYSGAEGEEFNAWLQYREDQNNQDYRAFSGALGG